MALKTSKSDSGVSTPEAPSQPETVILELALYKIYTWRGIRYEEGKPYRFKASDAMILLAEHDVGRPVWRLYRPEKPKVAPKKEIVDATAVHVPLPIEDPLVLTDANAPQKRIDIGDESEIADIVGQVDDGNVTV